METYRNILAYCAIFMALAACSSDEPTQTPTVKYPTLSTFETSRGEAAENDAINNFGLNFFNEVSKSDDPAIGHNFVISPTSMALCVSMIANACDQQTAQSIIDVMGCEDLETVNTLCKKLMQFLPDKSNKAELLLANSVWHLNCLTPSDDFKKRITDFYFGDIEPFEPMSAASVDRLNQWCRKNTANSINNAFNSLSPNTMLICLSTLFFQSEWSKHFDAKNTKRQIFHGINEDVEVEMMHDSNNMHYYEGDRWESVTVYYEGNNSMIVILPKDPEAINELAASITHYDILEAATMSEIASVSLSMPKFTTTSTPEFTEIMKKLGISCFSKNLQGFDNTIHQNIEQIIEFKQNTSISTDEKGTVAASVSAAISGSTSLGPLKHVDFTLDRPFIYMIRNSKTGSILIAGRYAQP